jgi:glycosyltransferase involved in cell wall biosynthesis
MQQGAEASNGKTLPSESPQADFELSVIVPTRNESKNVAPLLSRLGAALDGRKFEVLFVDDSNDDTPETVLRGAAGRAFPIKLIARPEERRNGLSGAVVEGMESAQGHWLCVIDADLQHPPEIIPRLLDQANRAGADVAVASRRADLLGPLGLSRARALNSQLLTILARMLFPRVLKNVTDPLTGFFLARRAAIDTAVLQPEGFKILLEILVRHPDLRVTEIQFDFAPRHEGQSKADLNEGVRFFRHLTRLRLTVNQHLIRFLIVVALAVVLNLLLLGSFSAAGWPLFRAASLAGGITIAAVLVGETWVFSDRPGDPVRRRLVGILLIGVVFLGFIYLPVIWLLAVRLGLPILIAGLAAMIFAGFFYYLFSEQWIWTRGLMMRPRASNFYNIHGLVVIDSQLPLSDLEHFRVAVTPPRIDLLLRVDRHGTPSRVPGSIAYDEHLGRFGFGLTVVPGDITEIVVSPLLETSPAFLYTNVVEPVLRWVLVTRGNSLARAGAVRFPVTSETATAPALLMSGGSDMSYGLAQLCEGERLAFMGDDRVIISRDGWVRSFPKPVTAGGEMMPERARFVASSPALRLQRLLYSRPIRRLGLFLSRRQLPAATVNTYLQRIIPQPKFPLHKLARGIIYGDAASPAHLVLQERGDNALAAMPLEQAIDHLLDPGDGAFGFQPYPLLINELGHWNGRNWIEEEREILRTGLSGCKIIHWRYRGDRWWEQVVEAVGGWADIARKTPASPLVNSI